MKNLYTKILGLLTGGQLGKKCVPVLPKFTVEVHYPIPGWHVNVFLMHVYI